MDALSELLRVVKLSGALFFDAECGAPWCVQSPPSRVLGKYIASPDSHVIEFHLVARGRCYIRVGHETTPLCAGDIAMLPHGDAHQMGNGLSTTIIDGESDMEALLGGQITTSTMGDPNGEQTRLICGYLTSDARLIRPLLSGLPHVVRVSLRDDAYGEALENMLQLGALKARSADPGGAAVTGRLAEVAFVEVLRRHLVRQPEGRLGWLAGAADAGIGKVLAAIHQQPAHPWTLDELAQRAGMGRSTLTERFSRCLGTAPMSYLTEWRLELAAESLRVSSRSVVRIAGEVGYESEAAFNRAFKRRFGDPPARYRVRHRQENGAA